VGRLALLVALAFVAGCTGSDAPRNGQIVASFGDGLQLVDLDAGTWRAIPGTLGGLEPTVSRDGRRIAFTRSRVERSESWEAIVSDLFVVRPGAAEARLVLRNASGPSWSPDAEQIAFMRDVCGARACLNVDNPYELFVVEVESGDERRLTGNERYEGDPAWSPDGDWIAFSSDEGLSIIRPDGRDRRTLTTKWNHSSPSWSPDGKQIAFSDYFDVYVIPVDGGQPRRLTDNRGPDFHPAWSSDGTEIAYLSNHVCAGRNGCTAHEPVHIRIMNADGSESHALTENGWGGPSWGPERGGA